MVSEPCAIGHFSPTGASSIDSRKVEMSKSMDFSGSTVYLFVSGLLMLLVVPFLPWFDYGFNFLFPSQVSMIYLFERGFQYVLILYLIGVASTLMAAAVARKPVFFQGILPAAFPVYILVALTGDWISYGYPAYLQALTLGMFMALLGSVLLEASYFSYRKRATQREAVEAGRSGR